MSNVRQKRRVCNEKVFHFPVETSLLNIEHFLSIVNARGREVVVEQAVAREGLPRAALAVVGVGVNGEPAAREELAPHLDVSRPEEFYQILHDGVHTIFVELAVVAEGMKVELEALALHAKRVRDVMDDEVREVRLPGDGADGGELRAVELDEVVVRVRVGKGLEQRGVVGVFVGGLAAKPLEGGCHGGTPIFR